LVDAVEAAAAALSQAGAVDAASLAEINAQSDRFLRALKDVHATLRDEIVRQREPHTDERTVYASREALQLTGLHAAVVGAHVDAMLAALPAATQLEGARGGASARQRQKR
tara:strand:- start:132 stop:464 length:333 start_codon:yes stop_codon:yes gene_type:complete